MLSTLRPVFLLLLLTTATVVTAAVPSPRPPARPFDFSKLPPNTIIVIGEEGKDALQQPGVIVLTPDKFKEMLDQIEQLKKQANPDRAEAPSRCKISGRIEGDVVYLQLQYEFETRKRKTLISLGGQKSSPNAATVWPTGVSLDDGKLPLLPPPGDDGLTVQIDPPGPHKLTLDLELLISARGAKGSERGFEIGLPRAAITTIDFLDVPEVIRELRCNARPRAAKDLNSRNGQRTPTPLGAADRLEVTWKGPGPQQVQPLQTAQGTLDVRIDETQVTTEAELNLQMKSGQTGVWQIQAPPPPQASLELDVAPTDPRAPVVTPPPADAKVPVWTIKLREPSDEPLKVRIHARQPRAGRTVAVAPFAVLQAIQQSGTITVSVPPELRFKARPRNEVSQREVPEELRKATSNVALFNYWNLPPGKADQLTAPALDLEVETVKGALESETAYHLRLTEQGWQVTATFDVTPVRTAVERLELDLPAEYDFKASPALLVEPDPEVKEPMAGRRAGVLKLAQKQTRPFKLTLEGTFPAPKSQSPALVPLPRLLQTLDRGARLTVTLPEASELMAVREPGTDPLPPDKGERAWRLDKTPPRVEVSWRDHRAELAVESVINVTLTDGQALVQQRLRILAAPEGIKELLLRSADMPKDRAPLVNGQSLEERLPRLWAAPLKQGAVSLEYTVLFRGRSFPVPLLWPEGATRCVTRLRVWSEAGTLPEVEGGAWEHLPYEVVQDRDSLPALVLRSSSPEPKLRLRLSGASEDSEAATRLLPPHHVDKALIQAIVTDGGQQTYRARFLLSRVGSPILDVDLPGTPAELGLEVLLDGLAVTTIQGVNERGEKSATGHTARLHLEPRLYRKPAVLDVRYQLAPVEGASRWQTTLSPPKLRGSVHWGQVRWLVALPSEWVALCPGSRATVEQRLGLRNNLLAPRPALSAADLERWFHAEGDESNLPHAELVCSQAHLGTLHLWHFPQQGWLLICSLSFLAVGLALYFAALPRPLFWGLLVVVGLGVLAVDLVWPGILMSVLYGCEPGVIVLLVVVGVQWFLQRRYRRQVVFMPGFSRRPAGSSIVRNGSKSGSHRLRGEPSTVDVPPGVPH